jgi:hypothetical protein
MLPKSGLRAQLTAAAVFVTFCAGIILFARSFRSSADEALGQEAEETTAAPPSTRHEPLTPKTATTAQELQAALAAAFGANARGLPSVTFVEYDRYPDRVYIALSLDDANLAAPGATTAALQRMRDVLEAIHDGAMPWTWVLMTGTAPVPDKNGSLSESTVIRAQFSRGHLRHLDWTHLKPSDIRAAAEQYWVNLDLGR